MATTVTLKIDADGRVAVNGIKQVRREAQKMGTGLNKAATTGNAGMTRLQATATSLRATFARLAVVVAATFGAGAAFSTIGDFQQSMAGVQAVTLATERQFTALREVARELGATTVFSASQAADAMRFLGQAGFDANEIISAVPATLELAAAASLDLANAADIASNILSAFNLETTRTGVIADALAETAASANTNVQQLGEAMSFVGPVASALSISVQDTAAAIGVLSDAGIQAGTAGTSLRRVLGGLAAPTGGAAKAIKEMGLTLEQVDPAANSLVDVVARFADAGITAADAMEIFGQRGGPAILALTSQVPRLRALTEGINDSEGAAKRAADTLSDTLQGDVKALQSAAQELILALGDAGVTGSLRGFVQALTDFARAVPNNIGLLKAFAIALSGLFVARILGPIIAGLVGSIRGLGVAAAASAGSVRVLRGALAFLGGPAGVLITVAAGLLAYNVSASTAQAETDDLRQRVLGLTGSFEELRRAKLQDALFDTQNAISDTADRIAELQANIDKLQSAEASASFGSISGVNTGQINEGRIAALREELQQAQVELEDMTRLAADLGVEMSKVGGDDIAARIKQINDELANTGETASETALTFEDLNDGFTQAIDKLQDQEQKLIGGVAAVTAFRIAQVAANGATTEQIATLKEQAATITALEQSVAKLEKRQKAVDGFSKNVQQQNQKLIETRIAAAGGERALLQYQIAQLEVMGVSEEVIEQLQEQADEYIELKDSIDAAAKAQENFEKFTDLAGSLRNQIVEIAGAGTGLRAYQREMFIAQQVSQLGEDATREYREEIEKLAGALFDLEFPEDEAKGFADKLGGAVTDGFNQGVSNFFGSLDEADFEDILSGDFKKVAEKLGIEIATNIGGSIGGALGGPIGESIGKILGSFIGNAIFGGSEPKFQVRGSNADRATDAGTDDLVTTALGELQFAFRKIEDAARGQIIRAFTEFDEAFASAIQDQDQLAAVKEALERFGVSSRADGEDIEKLLTLRFEAALGAFDSAIQSAVGEAGTLQQRVQRLADVLDIQQQFARGNDAGIETFEALISVVADLQRAGETLADTYDRLTRSSSGFESVLNVLNIGIEGSRESFVRFSNELALAAGGIDILEGQLSRFFSTFFDTLDVLPTRIAGARETAGGLLGQLGLDQGLVDDPEAFRRVFAELLPTLSPEDAATLLRASDAIGEVITLEERLAQARRENVSELAGLIVQVREDNLTAGLSEFQEELVNIQAEGLRTAQAIRDAAEAADVQINIEEELGAVHERTARRIAAAIARLEQSGRDLADRVFGSELDRLNEEISELERDLGGNVESIGSNLAQLKEELINFADSLLIGQLSPLTQGDQLNEALSQLQSASASGDSQAVQSLAQQVLGIARDRFASGQEFTDIFNEVQRIVRGTTPTSDQPQPVSIVHSPALEALIAQRDEIAEEQARQERQVLASELAQVVADIAGSTDDSFAEVASRLGFELGDLASALGIDQSELPGLLESLQTDTVSVAEEIVSMKDDIVAQLILLRQAFDPADGTIVFGGGGSGDGSGAGSDQPPPPPPPGGGSNPPVDPIGGGGSGPIDGPVLRPKDVDVITGGFEGNVTAVNSMNRDLAAILDRIRAENETAADALRRIADAVENTGSRGTTPVV